MLISEINNNRQSDNLAPELFYGAGMMTKNALPKEVSTLKYMIDEPCLKACEYLYNCNIRTLNSSANKNNVGGNGFITIDYATLDDTNKDIYNKLVERGILPYNELRSYDGGTIPFNIEVPITEDSTCEEFSKKMLSIAMMFKEQNILYGFYNEKELEEKALNGINESIYSVLVAKVLSGEIPLVEDGEIKLESIGSISIKSYVDLFAELSGFYYFDEFEKKYWLDKDLFDKNVGEISTLKK